MSFSSGFAVGYGVVNDALDRRADAQAEAELARIARETGVSNQPNTDTPDANQGGALSRLWSSVTGSGRGQDSQQGGGSDGDAVSALIRTPAAPFAPGQSVALGSQGGALANEVRQAAGRPTNDATPLTRPDWNAYADRVIRHAATLDPQRGQRFLQQLQAVEQRRSAAAMTLFGVAATSAENGDMQGFARAMNAASQFMPSGYIERVEVNQDGTVVVARQREGGQGEVERTAPMDRRAAAALAMGLIDPEKQRQYLLSVRQVDIAQQNADTSRQNANTSAGHLALANRRYGDESQDRSREIGATEAEARLNTELERLRQMPPDSPQRLAQERIVADARIAAEQARGGVRVGALSALNTTGINRSEEGRRAQRFGADQTAGQAEAEAAAAEAAARAAPNDADAQRRLADARARLTQARGALGGEGFQGAVANQNQNDAADAARRAREAERAVVEAQTQVQRAAESGNEQAQAQAREALRQAESQLQTVRQLAESRGIQITERRANVAEQQAASRQEWLTTRGEFLRLRANVEQQRLELQRETNAERRAERQQALQQAEQRLAIIQQNADTAYARMIQGRNPNLSIGDLRTIATEAEGAIANIRNLRPEHGDAIREFIVDFQAANRNMTPAALVGALAPVFSQQRQLTQRELFSGTIRLRSGQTVAIPDSFRDAVMTGGSQPSQPARGGAGQGNQGNARAPAPESAGAISGALPRLSLPSVERAPPVSERTNPNPAAVDLDARRPQPGTLAAERERRRAENEARNTPERRMTNAVNEARAMMNSPRPATLEQAVATAAREYGVDAEQLRAALGQRR